MLMGHHRQLCPLRPRASAVLPIELGRMEHIMDEKTSSAPMQEDPQKGEELSFTITGEDAEAQDALNAEKPEPQQKKKSPQPWLHRAAAVILAAATLVDQDGEELGKPGTAARTQAMLRALSGREHRVWSGVCIREGEKVLAESECTSVHFRALTDEEIHAYIATGEPLDKAGAYGYQGLASRFVERFEGDFFNVIGLPVCRMGQMLREFDISLL